MRDTKKFKNRRDFLKTCGAGGALSVSVLGSSVLSGCGSGSSESTTFDGNGGDLGQGDNAILNTFYGYKMLTTSLLQRVTAGGAALTAGEGLLLQEIYRQELVHLNLLRDHLGGFAIPNLIGFDFTSVPQDDGNRILDTVRTFEDVGVAGSNGSLRYLNRVENIELLARIAAADARHSAAVRDILDPGDATFAGSDVVGSKSGLEHRTNPYYVFSVVRSYGPVPVLDTGDFP